MTIGRAARRAERASLVESVLGQTDASAGLDLLELTELAWHDCYGEVTPPDDVILKKPLTGCPVVVTVCDQGWFVVRYDP